MIYPNQEERKPTLIFLDIDGVLTPLHRYSPLDEQIRTTQKQLFPHGKWHSEYQQNIALARHFNQEALESLHSIIEQVKASGQRPLVVLSSAWRHSALLKAQRYDIYAQHEFSDYLCGKTAIEYPGEACLSIECKLGFEFYKSAQEHYNISLESRGDAIEFWLRDHQFDPATANFIVIDDDHQDSLVRCGAKLIETQYMLKKTDVQAAIEVLCGAPPLAQ